MAQFRNTEIRAATSSRILGYLAAIVMKLWSLTLRYEVNGTKGLVQPPIGNSPVIFVLWHNRIFTMPPIWQKTCGLGRRTVVLTSASNDGTILAAAMSVFGLEAIRGSSSRRAISALIGMKKALRNGRDVCITPDGPRGPRYVVKPGIIKIAQTTDSEIIPIHIRYGSAWRLRSWDGFLIPKPLSRVSIIFDEPRRISKDLSPEGFEEARLDLQRCLADGADDTMSI